MVPSVFAACDDDDDDGVGPTPAAGLSFDLRSDVGIFRLVHTLEQLEGAFYTAVVASGVFSTFSAEEREVLTDIRDAEVIHREFLRTALGTQAVPDITGSINTATLSSILSSKATILTTARTFEHIGVAGLNGSGKYLQDARNLLLAGKLASVEARHAAALRDLAPPTGQNANTAFAGDDIIDSNGRDVKLEAGAVIARVSATGILKADALARPANPALAASTNSSAVPSVSGWRVKRSLLRAGIQAIRVAA